MPREPDPLPEQAITHMVFRVRGGPFGGMMREVFFKHGDRPRVGHRFKFAMAEKAWKVLVKGQGKTRLAEYEITRLPEEAESGRFLANPGELMYVSPGGVLQG